MICGQVCYGFLFEDGTEFPWDDPRWEGDPEAWWRDVSGYEPLECPYTAWGDYKPGYSRDDQRVGEYHRHRMTWTEENPLPVELVEYCCLDESMVILAVRSSLKTCDLGNPTILTLNTLTVTGEEAQALIHFCSEYGIEGLLKNCQWWLSCYRDSDR